MTLNTNKTSEAQLKATKKYREKIQADDDARKERNRKNQFRTAKSYIRLHSTLEDLEELEELIATRKKVLVE
ncbi:hypothetical protein [Enterococcus columbae]|uniref:Uncharacterized protein n=1 Tax=Enterococcus columbae DSM 7374 = ATCC 51263 TaxID=1121865 RepID=S0KXS5_9ENTE|nr:hypothetical protein [Enterococcus columbae]EOT44868.1 hypothetical protein OMW_00054 [Enterococcus columbae DSM 7374 = ATCC 51263]EOW84161.1 hypothetical protein I568_00648 [Enterococcus columbae DSM 7374 = ATCC 51263]OJG23353.1 hypothetical protein RR47_GL000589 [Enterococcus columbae DSM 7374 = ATCC 51263]